MVISELKATAERELKVDNIEECCIGIPGYFSDLQRAAVCQAAEVAGLHNVSLLEATTAIALGHGVIRRGIHQRNKEYNIAILDVASSIMQVSIVRFKSKTLDVLSFAYDASIGEKSFVDVLVNHFKNSADSVDLSLLEVCGNLKELSKQGMKVELRSGGKQISRSKFKGICEHIWNRMKVLLEEAMAQAAIGKEKVHGVLVSGSGAAIYGIKELLEEFFPRQSEDAEKHVFVAADSVAKGCAIQCAITSEEFKAREDNVRYKGTKESLLKFTVSDKWPCVKDKTTEVQVAQATYGRFILTPQEITDARESERKMAVREKVRVKVSDILKVKDFAKKEEIMELNKVNCQLDKDDLNEEFLYLALVEKNILARKYEHENKRSTSSKFTKLIDQYENLLSSKETKYRTIKRTAKDLFKEYCKEAREWLKQKNAVLSNRSKTDDSISFIDDVNDKIKHLEQTWVEAQQEREPDIEEIEYNIRDIISYRISIDDFRASLLKGTQKKEIKGCYLLPFQTELAGVPYKWFQLSLIGRNDESTTMHVKHHNVYNMAFDNKEGQTYEMGPGYRVKEGQDIWGLTCRTIAGSIYAGFNCDYISMVNPERLPLTTQEVLERVKEIKMGIEAWQNSIHVLSYHGCDPEHHKTCLLCQVPHALELGIFVISVMLNECTRMDALKDELGEYLTELLMQLIWSWRDMSRFLRRWDLKRLEEIFVITLSNSAEVKYNSDDVGGKMHLILNLTSAGKESDIDDQGPSSQPTPSGGDDGDKRGEGNEQPQHGAPSGGDSGDKTEKGKDQPQQGAPSGGDGGDNKGKEKKQEGPPSPSAPGLDDASKEQQQPPIGPGQNLLQIFSVSLRGVNQGDIRGIVVHEGRGSHVMYSCGEKSLRKRKNPLGVHLSGPSIAISSEAGCIFEVLPKTRNTHGPREDTMMNLDSGFSDRCLSNYLKYGNGEVIVSYTLLTGAVEANLNINLLLPLSWVTYTVSGDLTVTQQNGANHLSVSPTECGTTNDSRSKLLASHRRGRSSSEQHPLSSSSRYFQLPVSPDVLAVKLGDRIKIHGELHISKELLEIPEVVLQIPKKIGFIKTVKTDWAPHSRFPYCFSMTLISRNM